MTQRIGNTGQRSSDAPASPSPSHARSLGGVEAGGAGLGEEEGEGEQEVGDGRMRKGVEWRKDAEEREGRRR